MTHICIGVTKDCYNPYDSYGEICVHCNCCGRFDPKTKLQCQLALNKRMLQESRDFDGWQDEPKLNELQRKNVASDIEYFSREIRAIEGKIAEQESDDQNEQKETRNQAV